MIVIAGLGAIGASIGSHLAESGYEVAGVEIDEERRRSWNAESGCPVFATLDDAPWAEVSAVVVAVRMAEQVSEVFDALAGFVGAATRSVFVVSTLSMTEARNLFESHAAEGRLFEAPLSGGPNAARDGSMTLFVAGPTETDDERALIEAMSGRVFRTEAYGQPAGLKLFNNTLGAYNALSTATILDQASALGIDSRLLLEAICASSGQSWMSDNLTQFHDDLLFKDVGLLLADVPDLPATSLSEGIERQRARIAATRSRLAED